MSSSAIAVPLLTATLLVYRRWLKGSNDAVERARRTPRRLENDQQAVGRGDAGQTDHDAKKTTRRYR